MSLEFHYSVKNIINTVPTDTKENASLYITPRVKEVT